MFTKEWFQRRYLEFRAGNNIYIGFTAGLFSMLLVVQRFLIERIPTVQEVVGNLLAFVIIFLIVYIPLSISIGFWHYKNQEKIQQTYYFFQSPAIIKALRLILELKAGTPDKNDVEAFKNLLRKWDKELNFELK